MFSKADTLAMLFSNLSYGGSDLYKINQEAEFGGNCNTYLVFNDTTKTLSVFLNRCDFLIIDDSDCDDYGRSRDAYLTLTSGVFDPELLTSLEFVLVDLNEMLDAYPYLTPNAKNSFYECATSEYSVVIDDVGVYVRKNDDDEPCLVLTLAES